MKHILKFLIFFALSSPLVAQVFNEAKLKELIREIVLAEQIIPQDPLTKEAIQSAMREVLQEWSPSPLEPKTERQPIPNNSIEIIEAGYSHISMRWKNTWPDMAPVMIQRREIATFTDPPWRWVDVHFKKTGPDNYKINRIWEDQGGAAVRTNAVFYWWKADPGIRFDAYMLQKKPRNQYAEFIEFLN